MSIIISSDQVSSASIGNIYGIESDLNYVAMLDFTRQEYLIKKNGVTAKKNLNDVISFQRNSSAYYINSEGQNILANANEPRFQKLKNSRGFGVLMEGEAINRLTNPYSPITQTVTIPANSANVALVLSVKGTGSATLSGASLSGISNQASTDGVPQVAVIAGGSGAKEVTVTVSGALTHFQLETREAASGGVLETSIVPNGLVKRSADILSLSSEVASLLTGDFTLVVGLVLSDRLQSTPSISGTIPTIVTTNKSTGAIAVSQTLFIASVGTYETPYLRTSMPAPPNGGYARRGDLLTGQANNYTVAISNKSGAIENVHSINGVSGVIPKFTGTGELTAQEINGSITIGSGALNGVITHIAVFPRQMTTMEIEKLSTSWL